MKHVATKALRGSVAIIRKEGEDADPASIVTKALGEFSTEFEKKFDDRIKAIEGKGVDPKLVERLDKIEAKANRHGTGKDDDRKEAAEIELKSWLNYLRSGKADEITTKTLTVANDAQAGYLAPPEISTQIMHDLVLTSPIRQYATVVSSTAPSVKYPRRTSITNAQWEGEIEESQPSDVTFGQTEIVSRRLTTFVDISNSLLMGSNGVAETEVRQALTEDFAQKEGNAFILGDGVKQPEGILTAANVPYYAYGGTSFGTDATASDKFISMMWSMPAYYRSRGVWIMNGASIGKIALLKDAQGRYLFQPAISAGAPDTLLGRPIIEAVDMPDFASGKFPIVFGDIKTAYKIVDRMQLGTLSDPYTQARNAITRLHGTRWVGAGVVQPKALLKMKMSAS